MAGLSEERLLEFAKLCGGLAVLVGLAVFFNTVFTPNTSLVGAAVCSGGSCTDANGPLSISSSPDSVLPGGTSTISWTGTGATSLPYSVSCFGNGTGCNTTAYQSLSGLVEQTSFVYNGQTYMVGRSGTTPNFRFRVYKWTTVGVAPCSTTGGWGNGSTCGTPIQDVSLTFLYGLQNFKVDSDQYLIATTGSTNWNISLFKWLPSCNGGLGGFGNHSNGTCNQAFYTVPNSGNGISKYSAYTAPSGTFIVANYSTGLGKLYKWMPAGTPTLVANPNGCIGNGVVCGTVIQNLGSENVGFHSVFYVSTVPYVVIADENNGAKMRTYKHIDSCNGGQGGLGWGTTCGSNYTINPADAYAEITSGFNASTFYWGTDVWAAVGQFNSTGQPSKTSKLYKWIPTCNSGLGGWGRPSDNTCGNNNQAWTFPYAGGGYARAFNFSNGQPFIAHGSNVFTFVPTSNCLGNGSTCGTAVQTGIGAQTLISGGVEVGGTVFLQSGSNFYKGYSNPCFGNTPSCGVATRSADDATKSLDLELFTYGANTFVARAETEGSYSPVYQWMTGSNCIGNGTTCADNAADRSYQELPTVDAQDFKAHRIGTEIFLIAANHDTTASVQTYKWGPSGGVLHQTLQVGNVYSVDATTTAAGTFLAVGRDSSADSVKVYKWTPAGNAGCPATDGGWGNGSVCGASTPYQNLSTVPTQALKFFTIGTTAYLAVGRENATGFYLYKWTTSAGCLTNGAGFGDGVTCGAAYQAFAHPNIFGLEFYPVGATNYLVLRGVDSGIYIYQWRTTGTGCTAAGLFGNTTQCNGTPTQLVSLPDAFSTEPFTVGSERFLAVGKDPGSRTIQIYKWRAAANCFGNMYMCDTPLQKFPMPSGAYALKVVPSGLSPFLIASTYSAGTFTYQWLAGAGTMPACSVEWSTDNFATFDTFATGNSNSGINTDALTIDTDYRLSCTGISESVKVPVTVQSSSMTIAAAPTAIARGTSSVVSWDSSAIESGSCTVSVTPPSGSPTLFATGDTHAGMSTGVLNQAGTYTYVIACNDSGGSPMVPVSDTVGVAQVTSSPTSITLPTNQSTVSWTAPNTSSCTVTRSPAASTWSGTTGSQIDSYSSAGTYTYTLSCDSGAVVTTAQVVVSDSTATLPSLTLCPGTTLPSGGTCSFNALPSPVRKGASTKLYWNVTGLSASNVCYITSAPARSGLPEWNQVGASWTDGGSGWMTPAIQQQTIFRLTCTVSGGGSATVTKTVTLIPSFQEI